jgi:hypothetical protein
MQQFRMSAPLAPDPCYAVLFHGRIVKREVVNIQRV